MRILLVSDLHGKTPKIKQHFDLALCPGDLCFSDELRDFEFKHWKEFKDEKKDFHDLMPKKEYIRMFKKATNSADQMLQWLSKIADKIFLVTGNSDFDKKRAKEIKYFKALPIEEKIQKYKNICLIKSGKKGLKEFDIFGISGYRGFNSKFPDKKSKPKAKNLNLKWENKLKKLFGKKGKSRFSVFLAHDCPRNILDKISNKKSPINGKHIGDEYFLKMIKKHSPNIMVCGHMHENQGKKLCKKTLVINPGYGHDNHYAILEINDNKIKSLKFY